MLSAHFSAPAMDDAVVEAVEPKRAAARSVQASPAATPAEASAQLPQERLEAETRFNPFGPLNLQPPGVAALGKPEPKPPAAPPPPKASVAPEPPPPMAPPLPFTAIGSIEGADVTGGQPLAFLQQQDKLLVVRKGETIGQLYRVEAVSPDKVELTYLPLNQRQSLALTR